MGFPLLVCILALRNIQVTKICIIVFKCLLSRQLYCHYVKRIILRYFLTVSPRLFSKSCSSLWLQYPSCGIIGMHHHATLITCLLLLLRSILHPTHWRMKYLWNKKTPKFITIELPIVIENNSKCRIFGWDVALNINNMVFTQLLT